MSTEPKLPPLPVLPLKLIGALDTMHAYGAQCFEAGRQQPEPVAQWVSVDERLPEKNTEVLIAFKDCELPATGQYTGSHHDHEGWCYPAENIDDRDNPPTVTHWQPLPLTPAAAKGGE